LDDKSFSCFSTDKKLAYLPFADDFGPMNLACVSQFNAILQSKIRTRKGRIVVYCVENNLRQLTNAVFLLGSFMIIELGYTSTETWECLKSFEPMIEMYRDAQSTPATFRLELVDCWGGLERANGLRWIEEMDIKEYVHYNNPLEGGMNTIIPDKLIAFRGPTQLADGEEYRDVGGVRFFSPTFYVQPFLDFEVKTVINFNSRPYNTAPFEAAGIVCLHMHIDEGETPSAGAVAAFLDAIAAASGRGGAVALHCKEGRGRTGTMAAALLMAEHGFTAREAIGWLRIVRPGSVVGCQQQFLCQFEAMGLDGGAGRGCKARALLQLAAGSPQAEHALTPARSFCFRCASDGWRRRGGGGRRGRVRPQSAY
jgi:cell division cycle 14